MATIPRIRGRVGLCHEDEDPQYIGKWFFEISIWDFTGERSAGPPIQYGPWDSEVIAHAEMKKAVQVISETIEKEVTGKISGKYLDMKNGGVMRPWVDQ